MRWENTLKKFNSKLYKSDLNANCCVVFPNKTVAFHSSLIWDPLISPLYSVNSLAILVLKGFKLPRDDFLVTVFNYTLASKFTMFSLWKLELLLWRIQDWGSKWAELLKKQMYTKMRALLFSLEACHYILTSSSRALFFPFYSMRYNMLMFFLPLVWIYQFLSEISYYRELQ